MSFLCSAYQGCSGLCREASHKIWVGLNFYGRDFAENSDRADDILEHDFARIQKEHKPQSEWVAQAKEHVLSYMKEGRQHVLYYPSKDSMQVKAPQSRLLQWHCRRDTVWALNLCIYLPRLTESCAMLECRPGSSLQRGIELGFLSGSLDRAWILLQISCDIQGL